MHRVRPNRPARQPLTRAVHSDLRVSRLRLWHRRRTATDRPEGDSDRAAGSVHAGRRRCTCRTCSRYGAAGAPPCSTPPTTNGSRRCWSAPTPRPRHGPRTAANPSRSPAVPTAASPYRPHPACPGCGTGPTPGRNNCAPARGHRRGDRARGGPRPAGPAFVHGGPHARTIPRRPRTMARGRPGGAHGRLGVRRRHTPEDVRAGPGHGRRSAEGRGPRPRRLRRDGRTRA